MSVDFSVHGKTDDMSVRFGNFEFFRFRYALAQMVDSFAGTVYYRWVMSLSTYYNDGSGVSDMEKEYFKEHVPPVLYKFLFMSDCEGNLQWWECGRLYKELRALMDKRDMDILFKKKFLEKLDLFLDLLWFAKEQRRQMCWM